MTAHPRFEGSNERNVFGEPLQPCSTDPLTGFFRTGYCAAGPDSAAVHLVCIEATAEFLEFSASVATTFRRRGRNSVFQASSREIAGVSSQRAGCRRIKRAGRRGCI